MNHDEIRAALAAATPGPWDAKPLGSEGYAVTGAPDPDALGVRAKMRRRIARFGYQDWDADRANAELVAKAPTWLAELLAEVDALTARAEAAVQVMNEHNCGKAAEAAYRRAVRAEQAVQRVRELHAPMQHGPKGQRTICVHCFARYPCTTTRALDGGES